MLSAIIKGEAKRLVTFTNISAIRVEFLMKFNTFFSHKLRTNIVEFHLPASNPNFGKVI